MWQGASGLDALLVAASGHFTVQYGVRSGCAMAGWNVHFQGRGLFFLYIDAHRGCTFQEELLVFRSLVLFYRFGVQNI
jgi:hypothetical protein